MAYIYVGAALSLWFALAGVITVLKPQLKFYITTLPISLAMTVGFFAGTIDEHLGYEHISSVFFPRMNGFSFYQFLFMKNWAYSIFIICAAFLSYELAKLATRKYRAKNPRQNLTTGEFMRDLPEV